MTAESSPPKQVATPITRSDRPFTLIDAMILVAATAVACVIMRPYIAASFLHGRPWWSVYHTTLGVLITWSPTVLLLRFRRPRPTLRQLSRQPGFAACLSGTAIVAIGSLAIGLLALMRVARREMDMRAGVRLRAPDPLWWLHAVTVFGAVVGPAVMGAWLLLAFSGRRRPSKSWLDLLGRGLGIAWIIVFAINTGARLQSECLRD